MNTSLASASLAYECLVKKINEAPDIQFFANENALKLAESGDGRFILNYSEAILNTPRNWISHFCRGLTLAGEPGNYEVIAKAFDRFYNDPEDPEYLGSYDDIDWAKPFEVQFKYDGSLILAYTHDGKPQVNTRGSFADGKPSDLTSMTWRELFFSSVINGNFPLKEGVTHAFELCSPYNQIVEYFPKAFSTQLAIFNNKDGTEERGAFKGERYEAYSKQDVLDLIEKLKPIQEGFVIAQWDEERKRYRRKKFKTKTWAKLAHIREGLSKKGLMQILFNGEKDEIVSLFPHTKPQLEELELIYNKLKLEAVEVFEQLKDITDQKEFALKAVNYSFKSVLFESRKTGQFNIPSLQNYIFKSCLK